MAIAFCVTLDIESDATGPDPGRYRRPDARRGRRAH